MTRNCVTKANKGDEDRTLLPPSFSMATHAQCFALYTNQSLFVFYLNIIKKKLRWNRESSVDRGSERKRARVPSLRVRQKKGREISSPFPSSNNRWTFDSYILKTFVAILLHRCSSDWKLFVPSTHRTFFKSPFSSSFSPNNHTHPSFLLIELEATDDALFNQKLEQRFPSFLILILSLSASATYLLLFDSPLSICSNHRDFDSIILEIFEVTASSSRSSPSPSPSLLPPRFLHTLACASSAHPSRSPGVARRNGRLETVGGNSPYKYNYHVQ